MLWITFVNKIRIFFLVHFLFCLANPTKKLPKNYVALSYLPLRHYESKRVADGNWSQISINLYKGEKLYSKMERFHLSDFLTFSNKA